MVPFLIRTIGEAGYGMYVLIWSLLMGIDQLERSLQSGVVKYSAAFLADERIDEVNRVVSCSFISSVLLAIIAFASICVIAVMFNDVSGDLSGPLLVVGVLILLTIPLTPYVAVIQSRQCYYVNVLANTLSQYVSLVVVIMWFMLVGPSVEALVVIMALILFLSRIVQVPIAHHLVPGLQNRPALFDRQVFRLILSFGGMTVVVVLCRIANTAGVRWLMGSLVSTSFVAHLAIMLMPGILLSEIVLAMTITIMPAASAYAAKGDEHMLRELLLRGMRYTAIIVLTGLWVAFLWIEDVLVLWVGPDYVSIAPHALTVFASVAFLAMTSAAHHMLKGLGKLGLLITIAVIGRVVVPFSVLLAVYFLSGNPYFAVTAGLGAGNVVLGLLNIGSIMRAVHADVPAGVYRSLGQPLIAAAIVVIPVFTLMHYGDMESVVVRMLITALGILMFLAQMYFVFATQVERQQAKDITRVILQKMPFVRAKPSGRQARRRKRHASVRLGTTTVTKTATPDLMRIEVEKHCRAFEIAKNCDLFRVPEILDYDDAKGIAVFERLQKIHPVYTVLDGSVECQSLMENIGRSLAVIHRDLTLPDEMTIALPPEFASRGTEAFLHGDFNGVNVCVGSHLPRIAILDWQMTGIHGGKATYGSRYFDIMWFINYMLWAPTMPFLFRDPVTPAARAFLESYFKEADIPPFPDTFVSYARQFFAVKFTSRLKYKGWRRRCLLPRSQALTLRFVRSLDSLRPN